MMKKILSLFLCLTLSLFLVGCGAPEDVPRAEIQQEAVEEEVTPPQPPQVAANEADYPEVDDSLPSDEQDTVPGPLDEVVEAESEIEEESVEVSGASGNEVAATGTFTFEGYALGGAKSHDGTFEDAEYYFTLDNGVITGARVIIQATSVKSDSSGLDSHLRNEDFFAVDQYPTIEFTSTDVTDTQMTGELTFLGVTETVSFAVERSGNMIKADFILDAEPFGWKYTGVSRDVRISFDMQG